MKIGKVGFIGLGLIGGSIAKAIRRFHPECEISAFDVDTSSLSLALHNGIIHNAFHSIDDYYSNCDIIFLCTPVSNNNDYLQRIKKIIKPGSILTDVGSVKSDIHEKVEEMGLEENFVGGHPMTGSEKSGFENSTGHLLENSFYVLTPSKKVSEEFVESYREFVASLGALPLILDYREHDHITAMVSHLPHVIAASLVNLMKSSDSADEKMKMIAAGGFKDITRIASSSPTMWQQICLTNKDNIVSILKKYINSLEQIKETLESKNSNDIYEFFSIAKEYRNSIPNSSVGPIKKVYEIYCDIIDEAGGIATIATILAVKNISIKNIGIIHNREYEEGVLKVEFYHEHAAKEAANLLKKHRYTVYER